MEYGTYQNKQLVTWAGSKQMHHTHLTEHISIHYTSRWLAICMWDANNAARWHSELHSTENETEQTFFRVNWV